MRLLLTDQAGRRRSTGFTLLELLLALGVTGLVAAAVVAMLVAASYGTNSEKDMRRLLIRQTILSARISAAVRSSIQVLEQGNDFLVLWMGDTRDDDGVNLSEIRLIELDQVNDEVLSYIVEYPDAWTQAQIDAADSPVLVSNYAFIIDGLKSGSLLQEQVWATGTTALTLDINNVDPQAATLVSYSMVLADGDMTDNAVAAVSLRQPAN